MKVLMTWAVLAGLFCTTAAHAGLLPVNVTRVGESNGTRFEYSVILQSNSLLRTGDYFTIYDFAGLVADTNTQPSNFSFSTAGLGETPSHVIPADDPSIPNLTFTYTGADTQVGELGLGTFSAVSHYSRTRDDYFSGQSHRQVDGHLNSNITDTQVPVPCHPPAVPEPSSLLLLGLAIPVALGVRAFRKTRVATI